MRQRAGVVIVENGRVLLMKRVRAGQTYYLFPGGGVEAGETPEQAAAREAMEELGVSVAIGRLTADGTFRGNQHFYFAAVITGGEVGTGTGPEFTDYPPERGTYTPTWVDLGALARIDVRPRPLAEALTKADWAERPTMHLVDV